MKHPFLSAAMIVLFPLCLMMTLCPNAFGMPIADYKGKMTSDERFNYLSGAISALSFQYGYEEKRAKSKCVTDWFYRSGKGSEDMVVELMKARLADPSLHVEAVILAVIKKKCGHLDQ